MLFGVDVDGDAVLFVFAPQFLNGNASVHYTCDKENLMVHVLACSKKSTAQLKSRRVVGEQPAAFIGERGKRAKESHKCQHTKHKCLVVCVDWVFETCNPWTATHRITLEKYQYQYCAAQRSKFTKNKSKAHAKGKDDDHKQRRPPNMRMIPVGACVRFDCDLAMSSHAGDRNRTDESVLCN